MICVRSDTVYFRIKVFLVFGMAQILSNPKVLIYFDAFAPSAQPELWTDEVFEKMFKILAKGGCLVTYCAKGVVKRSMKAAGFEVERLPGPPRKREMTRAWKR